MVRLFERTFPVSFREWASKKTTPSKIFDQYAPLECGHCGRDVLQPQTPGGKRLAIVGFARDLKVAAHAQYVAVYVACKGDCDRAQADEHRRRSGASTGWVDLDDLLIPAEYLRTMMATMNRLRAGFDAYTDEAFEELKHVLIASSQFVLKEMNPEDTRRVLDLLRLSAHGL